jgi:membrane-associated HD superfamily phosphohydrolase
MFIGEFEINPEHRGTGVVQYFIKTLYHKNPQAKRLVFLREYKYPGRDARTYTREQVAKRLEK